MSGSRARIIDGRAFDSAHEAERILAEARGRAEELYREARERGRAEGRADAGALLASAQATAARRLESAERELCRIVIAATERIVRAELATRPEAVLGVIREVIDQARLRRELTLRVNPADLRAIEHERAALVARLTEHGYLEICADPGITCGGCILESEIGRIDARLETQLEALERAMLDTLEPGAHWATRDDQA